MINPLDKIIQQHKTGQAVGMCSVCSANRFVLEAAMVHAKALDTDLLIESTSNQVDQFGGYSGMTPRDFVAFVSELCEKIKYPFERVLLGGDHLGPNVWHHQHASQALAYAREQINAYVEAGYTKIHLDTSMRCADDPGGPGAALAPGIIAERAADLAAVAEAAGKNHPNKPLYVIGTEVPVPGGAQEQLSELRPTIVQDLTETINITRKAFYAKNLYTAWGRIIAVVVQPGVEYNDAGIISYDRDQARHLARFIEQYEHLVYEAHSTDYQTREKLTELVQDHFAILKVGPALTFALREAIFALAQMEQEYIVSTKFKPASNILTIIDTVMRKNPGYWQKYYHGDEPALYFARKYSYSDRIRYYWPDPDIHHALVMLIENLQQQPVPLSLLSQFMPNQYRAVRTEEIMNDPVALIYHKIGEVLTDYTFATNPTFKLA